MKATINGLPLYEALIDSPDNGMFCISLVDAPAVESDFVAFATESKEMFRIIDEDKRRVRGVVMRANFPIYRVSEEVGEYYITFSPDTIRAMAEKYLYEGRQNFTTVHHIDGAFVEGIHLVQYFIKDTAQGVAPSGFEDISDGSLFAEFQVYDDYLWQQIKEGTFKGFSLEGVFAIERVENQPIKNSNMSIRAKIKEALAKAIGEAFAQVATDKGTLRWENDGDLKAGDEVFYIDEEGNESKPEDGDYKTEDGKVIRVADGKVVEIVDDKAEVSEEGEEVEPEPEENDHEERIKALEAAVAELREAIEALGKADVAADMAKVREEVTELREAMAKATPKGIAEKFEQEPSAEERRLAGLVALREGK